MFILLGLDWLFWKPGDDVQTLLPRISSWDYKAAPNAQVTCEWCNIAGYPFRQVWQLWQLWQPNIPHLYIIDL